MGKTFYNKILNDVMLWQAFAQSTFSKERTTNGSYGLFFNSNWPPTASNIY